MRAVGSPSRRPGPQQSAQHAAPPVPSADSGVQVLVRVRPPLPRELMFDSGVDVRPPYDIKVYNDAQEFSGRYHHVFGEDAPQATVYEKVRDCVPLALDGYNSTIFAYGQTGTGKTFTMMGDDPTADGGAGPGPGNTGGPGIIPRAVKELFKEAKAKQDAEGAAIQVIVSYMEIYNDRLHDLLQPYKPHSSRDPADMNQKRALLEVREDAKGNTYVPNLLCVKVKSYKSVYQLIAKGNRNRAVRHTEMNQASSRSHAILQLVIEQWPNGGADGTVLRSKLNFVDLAGSERWNTAAGGWDGSPDLMGEERINEMTAINGSLSALGSVVAALTERRPHIPYRDSRLTHLLQDSLGGNCRTTVLATLSPSVDAFEESCSTLRFADRARAIANNPIVNASRDVGSVLALKEREIQRLRNMLSQYTAGGRPPAGADGADGSDAARLAEELEETRRALEMERALRAELQQRLTHQPSPGSPGGAEDGTAINMDVRGSGDGAPLSTPQTAFDAAGGPLPRAGSMRSSAGSAGSAGGRVSGSGEGYFRLSTPSTPLNAVPAHLAGLGAGGGATATPSTVLTPTRSRRDGGGVPPLGRSRSNLIGAGGAGAGGGGGGVSHSGPGPSPGRRGDMRRLSFDEAIMAIKSQIITTAAQQERARLRARQPPPRAFWGGLPPPPGPSHPPPLPAAGVAVSTSALAPGSLNVRTRAVMGVYGNGPAAGGGGGAALSPSGGRNQTHNHQHNQHSHNRPPALSMAPGVVGSAALGGGGGASSSLSQIPSIDMTASPTGSDIPSPGDAHLMKQRKQPPHQRQQAQARDEDSPPPAAAARARGPAQQPHLRGPGRGRDSGSGEDEEEVMEEEGDVEEEVEEEGAAERSADIRGKRGDRGKGDSADDVEGDLSQLDREEYEELMREAREALAKAGTGAGAKAGAGAGPGAAGGGAGGGGGRSALLQQPASAPGGDGTGVVVSGAGWGRNALLHKFSDGDAANGGSAVTGGGGGFGRSALLASAPGPITSPSPASAPAASGWGRRSILAAQSATALPVASAPAPTSPPPQHAPIVAAAAAAPTGRRALIAELMADSGEFAAKSPYSKSPQRSRGKGRSKSVGGVGRPNGSRGNAADRVAKLDAGSWIYILGASASSTKAKNLASALQLDPRTGLPALF